MPEMIAPNVLSWASQLDDATREQAARTAALPFVRGHLALMPDAHYGKGSTVGSVIPTEGAIIPAAVGVDIGCGMVSARTDLTAGDLPDDLGGVLARIERGIPAGVGRGHEHLERGGQWLAVNQPTEPTELTGRQIETTCAQFGTLGSGNHFVEVLLDEHERVWVMLHSGSRGIGNQLAQRHIARARGLMQQWFVELADPDLAYFVQGTPEFAHYVGDLLWAQRYAYASRERMMDVALESLFTEAGGGGAPRGAEVERVNCFHNYSTQETHHGKSLWITRKGAILAADGVMGIIPGSMGTRSYIVRGKGDPASYDSCAHGAGRAMSRAEAKRRFTRDDLVAAMEGKTWLKGKARALIDEIPQSYKDIDQVMADSADLVEVVATLRQVLNYKGT